jgi:hypothetical protein
MSFLKKINIQLLQKVIVYFVVLSFSVLVSWDKVMLCSPGWPGAHNPPASAFWVLGLHQAPPAHTGPKVVSIKV